MHGQLRPDLAEFADAALAGGVDVIQLREKGMEAREELAALAVLAEACARHGALLSVNDRADVAWPRARTSCTSARTTSRSRGPARSLGDRHRDRPLDPRRGPGFGGGGGAGRGLLLHGPVLADPDEAGPPGPGPGPGPGDRGSRHATRPWFAIGGIDEARLPEVLAAGASRVVVVRAITEAADPRAAASRLAATLRG